MVAPTAGFISRNMLTIFVSATATAAVVLIGLHAVHRYQIYVMFSIALISNLMPYIHQGPVSSQSVQLFAATAVMMVICFVVALFEWRLSRDSESQLQAHINLNHELEEMHYAESRALADLTERYDTFNHDISTPVTALINLPNLLRSTGLSDEQARYVDTLERTHATVLAMVRDGRSGSSPAAGAPSVIRTIHVESFLSRILDQFHNSGSRDGMKISYRLPDPIPAIDVPLTDLTRIMNNLLHNAVKYAGNGTVIISGMLGSPAPASGYRTLTLTVRDTGVGMTESRLADVRAGLNGPDETVDSSRGIGLRSCRRLLAGHGGSLEIESREGAGTTVTVRIPVSVAE
jgi:signal transduction histidine kinase